MPVTSVASRAEVVIASAAPGAGPAARASTASSSTSATTATTAAVVTTVRAAPPPSGPVSHSSTGRHGVAKDTDRRAFSSWENTCGPAHTCSGAATTTNPANVSSARRTSSARPSARQDHSSARPTTASVTLVLTDSPSTSPARPGCRAASTTAARARAVAMTSTWAPSTTTPNTTGFAVHSRSTRPCQRGPVPARSSSQRTASQDSTTRTCHTQTVWRRLAPPTSEARACRAVAAGP
ncbi:hypothetical protein GCM10009657_21760 [Oryzihumus leptocrescens]